MAKYVYRRPSGVWEAKIHLGNGKLEYVGVFPTEEEAEYKQRVAEQGHHWMGLPRDIPSSCFGFTYEMEELATGRLYIGSKQFLFWDGPIGGYKATDPSDEWFDRTLWRESDWRTYTSSSKEITKLIGSEPWRFRYRVLTLCHNKLELLMSELHEQIERDVLTAVDDQGNYRYLNANILGSEYRPPVPREKLRLVIDKTAKATRDYYLRPTLCQDCGEVVPYGETQCPNKPMFGGGSCMRAALGGQQ